jgi:DNA-binding NarL/FixJ family response regulator
VVILSAEATPDFIRRLLADGALAYLTKPIDLAELGPLLDSLAASTQVIQARTGTPDVVARQPPGACSPLRYGPVLPKPSGRDYYVD